MCLVKRAIRRDLILAFGILMSWEQTNRTSSCVCDCDCMDITHGQDGFISTHVLTRLPIAAYGVNSSAAPGNYQLLYKESTQQEDT